MCLIKLVIIQFEIPFLNVCWKNEAELDVRYKEQKEAYNNILAGCEILKSIKPMADKILSGYQNKEYEQAFIIRES